MVKYLPTELNIIIHRLVAVSDHANFVTAKQKEYSRNKSNRHGAQISFYFAIFDFTFIWTFILITDY